MLHLLSWNQNGDRLDVAVATNRLVAAGFQVHRLCEPAGHAEAGDYLLDAPATVLDGLRKQGVSTEAWASEVPPGANHLKPVKIVMLAGEASAYPYYGYYALALNRLGYSYRAVSGGDIAAGALDDANILILPGGFSNWSLDAKEQTSGADMAVRRFFQRGGAAVVSCGGAYYLAKGRSTWLGVADARPRITQDYLRTGVGMVTCRLNEGYQRLGLPPTLELPYFHGPVFDEIGQDCEPLATFRELNATGRLFIDNPLTPETFETHMAGRIAVLETSGARGRAILFSPHPEMGDLLAKYIAFEGYIAKYQPIRGDLVMRETLDAYRPEESRSFLMILNAIETMAWRETAVSNKPSGTSAKISAEKLSALADAWRGKAGGIRHTEGTLAVLEQHVLSGIAKRMDAEAERLAAMELTGEEGARLTGAFDAIASHALEAWKGSMQRRPAETLLELELALLLMESSGRLCSMHQACTADV